MYGFVNMAILFLEIIAGIVVFILLLGICISLFSYIKRKSNEYEQRLELEAKAKEEAKLEAEKAKLNAERQKAKEQANIQMMWAERIAQFGEPTKIVDIYSNPLRNVAIYEPLKIIFINGTKYNFSDILSCRLETKTKVTKGKETHISKPDSGEMAVEQLLYGMGKKYNVKTQTEIFKEPDKISYTYFAYIGVNDISNPMQKLTFYSSERANELISLINIIIKRNS